MKQLRDIVADLNVGDTLVQRNTHAAQKRRTVIVVNVFERAPNHELMFIIAVDGVVWIPRTAEQLCEVFDTSQYRTLHLNGEVVWRKQR